MIGSSAQVPPGEYRPPLPSFPASEFVFPPIIPRPPASGSRTAAGIIAIALALIELVHFFPTWSVALATGSVGFAMQDYFNTAVRHLSYVRNICAHHGRLWNRQIVEKLPTMKSASHEISIRTQNSDTYRIFQTLVLLSYLSRRSGSKSGFEDRCLQLVSQHRDLSLHMGFPTEHDFQRL